MNTAMPDIRSPLPPEEAVARLERLAKRGGLPGFDRLPARAGGACGETGFKALVFGAPFDRELIARAEAAEGGGCIIRGRARLRMKLPVMYAIIIALTIWPGVWLTDSMLRIYFSWYRIETWWWYLPLCALVIPAVRKQWKASESAAASELAELSKKIAAETGGAA